MHSSRMRTVHCSDRLSGEGQCQPRHPSMNRITDRCQNITFLQLLLQMVIKHSSRMHTTCLETESTSSFSDHQTDFTLRQGVGPEMNKSEQVLDDATGYH